jgi:hypothetical protein
MARSLAMLTAACMPMVPDDSTRTTWPTREHQTWFVPPKTAILVVPHLQALSGKSADTLSLGQPRQSPRAIYSAWNPPGLKAFTLRHDDAA